MYQLKCYQTTASVKLMLVQMAQNNVGHPLNCVRCAKCDVTARRDRHTDDRAEQQHRSVLFMFRLPLHTA